MSLITYPEPSELSVETRDTLAALPPLNIFRMMSHAPHLIKPFAGLGGTFLQNGTLDPITRECAILRVGYLCDAPYETAQHEKIGRDVGMRDALIEAVKKGPGASVLTPEQRLAIMFTDCLIHMPTPTATRIRPVLHHFGQAGLQELTLLIGYYMMVCRYLNTFGIEVEEGGPAGVPVD